MVFDWVIFKANIYVLIAGTLAYPFQENGNYHAYTR